MKRILIRLKNRIVNILKRFGTIRDELKRNPSYRRSFRVTFFSVPIILISAFVILPLFFDPWGDFTDSSEGNSELMTNQMAEASLQSRLVLSKSDSLYLVVDLEDSIVSLCIRGVPVRECPITRIRFSRAFRVGYENGSLAQWLAEPFTGQKIWSTIPKSILHVKTAPRDTLEARQNYREPIMPVENTDVYLTMCFDKNLQLDISQNTRRGISGLVKGSFVHAHFCLYRLYTETGRLFTKRFPRHTLWIRVEIGREDARAIYRAIPERTQLAIRFVDFDTKTPENQ